MRSLAKIYGYNWWDFLFSQRVQRASAFKHGGAEYASKIFFYMVRQNSSVLDFCHPFITEHIKSMKWDHDFLISMSRRHEKQVQPKQEWKLLQNAKIVCFLYASSYDFQLMKLIETNRAWKLIWLKNRASYSESILKKMLCSFLGSLEAFWV